MKRINILFLIIFLEVALFAQELQIKANSFSADGQKGLSLFSGHVQVKKGNDELNASKVIIYTDKKNKPTKFVAEGNVSFFIETKKADKYKGRADKVLFLPKERVYSFYGNVNLKQLNEKKEIIGDEVTLGLDSGRASAKGMKKEPVIMIFDIKENKE
ncbi:OstA family organic solvent tolerance protein [hydrothermal vent metagenome]|uniref:OstA family organic solvent tolerance protein n=1 Tax=hydrothermal vent metagenome TaxID=652676 RepID=A0A1W1CSL7_9ZZZZ